ncbi:MAG: ABC transporter ATP-binding protein [Nostocaceae cyanobacterium]|nr:ABC transporter ATP-binding protein [Nostocaceae cyanobacterium]
MSTTKLLLSFAKPYPGWIILTIVLGFSGALFNGVGTTLVVPVILKIVGQEVDLSGAPPIIKAIMYPFDEIPETYRILVMSAAIVLTIFLKNAANYASSLVSSSLTRRLTSDMREAGLRLLLEIDIDYYAKMKVGDIINRLGGELARAANAISNSIKLVIIVITILVFVALLVSISWQLTIAATFLLSLVTLINQYTIARSKQFGKQLSEMSKSYSITVLETLNGMRLVKATGNEDREYQRIQQLIREREKADFQSQMNSQAIAPLSEVLGITALILIVFCSKILFKEEIISLSTVLLTYLLILLRLLPFISQLNTLRSSFANTSTSVEIVAEFLNRDNKPLMNAGNFTYKSLKKGIHFHNVSFCYPGHEKLVLKDVDLYLPRGTTLALVGSSGAGKSTLADLLPRFYDPISGCITIDGVDLREFDLKTLRTAMGIVSQDTFLFNDSIKKNIAYGKPSATEAEIVTAAQLANAYEFIQKLPQGFDTMIGDRGVMLSGGQRQRLAIARALLQDPEILILDEATSALDTVSERLVQEAIDNLSQDRTTLVIAHRLSTVHKADQIAVLEQGRVVEVGGHTELLQKGGYYSRLYSMQFGKQDQDTTKLVQKVVAKRKQGLIRISQEIRTNLNSMIASLNLLLNDMPENPQERQELIEESYQSAWKILNTIDIFEDIVHLQSNWKSLSVVEENQCLTNQYQNLSNICNEFRTNLHPMLYSLRCLADNVANQPEQQSKLIAESYQTTMDFIKKLENL